MVVEFHDPLTSGELLPSPKGAVQCCAIRFLCRSYRSYIIILPRFGRQGYGKAEGNEKVYLTPWKMIFFFLFTY